MHDQLPLVDVARLEEARLARAWTELADEHVPWCGGVMACGAPGLWCNSAVGAGMSGPVQDADLEVQRLRAFYEEKGIEPRLELAPFADETLRAALERAGFVIRMFEMVFARELRMDEQVSPVVPVPGDLTLEVLDVNDRASLREAAEVVFSGFLAKGQKPTDAEHEFFERNARHPACVTLLARVNKRLAGVSAQELRGQGAEVTALFGAVTAPEFRRRGVQQAMLAWRLNHAGRAGARLATIGSKPGVATERNVRRMGFFHAYTKVALVRPGAGLQGVRG